MKVINGSPSWITALVLSCFFLVLWAQFWYSASTLIESKHKKSVTELALYQGNVLSTASEALSGHLVTPVMRARELAKARIFRGAVANFASVKQENKDQAQEDFANFIGVSGFMAGHLFSPEGILRATTMGKLEEPEKDFYAPVRDVAKTRQPYFSPMYVHKGLLVSNLFIPVYPAHIFSESTAPDHVLVLVVPLQDILRTFLTSIRNLDHETSVRLVQQTQGQTFQEIVVDSTGQIKVLAVTASFKGVNEVAFGQRADLDGKGSVYSSAANLPAVGWWIAAETDADVLATPIREYRDLLTFLLVVGGLLAMFFIISVVLFFSRYRHHREEKNLTRELADLRQALVMESRISKALPAPICLVSPEAETIVYANQPFAAMSGKPQAVLPGLALSEVFDPEQAQALRHGAQMVAMSKGRPHCQVLRTYHGPTPCFYEVTALQCASEDEKSYDVQFLFREITAERAKHEQDISSHQQIIDALVRTVEKVPFLEGHTALLRQLSIEMAETLLLGDAQCSTVAAVAVLSQTGKAFVPQEIMLKKDTLTPEEIREARRYVEHACAMMEDIDVDLPVLETVRQIQETLDGSGYPHGLKNDEISMPARILGVANAFSAMVKKRAYRDAKTAGQALEELRQCPGRYDATVVRALESVMLSDRGQRMLRERGVEVE